MLLELLFGRYPDPEDEQEDEPEEMEPEEAEEEYTTDRGDELRPSDYVSPFSLTIVGKKKYLQMLEYAEDLEADNKRMARRLALCEGNYYLKDSKSWGDELRGSELARAKAEAEAVKLQRIVDDQNGLIERYRQRIKSLEAETDRLRDEATGQFEEVGRTGMSTEEKQICAYWMREAGASDKEIALKIQANSVRAYVAKGRKLMEARRVFLESDDVAFTQEATMADLDCSGKLKTDPNWHIMRSSAAEFEKTVAMAV